MLMAVLALAACGAVKAPQAAHTAQPPLGYRSLPTFLPHTNAPVDQIVTASLGHPQLATQGVGVRVNLPDGHVLATVTGPKVPPFVAPPPPVVTTTFTITLAKASGSVPIRLSDFSVTDQLGRTYHLALIAGEAPPSSSAHGSVAFHLTAVMPTGEGRLHWAPTGGAPVVSWDFIVEND